MIACDEDDDANSFLNKTGSTHPDSFFLDIVFDEARIPRVPQHHQQSLKEPPKLLLILRLIEIANLLFTVEIC